MTALLVAGVLSAAQVPTRAAADEGSPAPTTSYAGASAQARVTGQPVDVPSLTDEHSTTQALPDGTFERSISSVPERVQRDGQWRDLDASLERNADGTYSPTASVEPLVLSGGGAAALATLHSDDSKLALSWPRPLPTPAVDGASLTYGSVLPDVDLQVTAGEQGGISEVLIVKNAVAAANPALDELKLAVNTTNATLRADSAGNLAATASDGSVAFNAPTPLMWDSGTSNPAVPVPDGSDPSLTPPTTADVSPIGVDVASGQLTLTPNQDLLESAETNYPVYIDPEFIPTARDLTGWVWAQEAFPNSSWWKTNTNGMPAVGYQGWQAGSQGRNRSYYQFDIANYGQAHINSASLYLTEIDTGLYDCAATEQIDVYSTAAVGASTDWNHQPTRYNLMDSADVKGASNANGCSNQRIRWYVTNSVRNSDSTVTYDVQAPDGHEDQRDYYRRFASNGDSAAVLTLAYNWPPSAPTAMSMTPAPRNPATNCNNASTAGWVGALDSSGFGLSGRIYDKDQPRGQVVSEQFQIWDRGGSGTAQPSVVVPMGATSSSQTPGTTTQNYLATKRFGGSILHNGHKYEFQARNNDGLDLSDIAAQCYFWYDDDQPNMQNVTSADFNTDGTGTGVSGHQGKFTLSARDVVTAGVNYSKIDKFVYSFSSGADLAAGGGTVVQVSPTGADASADILYTPTLWGSQYLYVAAIDNAGNQSDTFTRQFYVRDDPNAKVSPGDITGDERPDVLGISNGSLYVYRTVPASGAHLPAPIQVAPPALAPGGVDWTGTLISHRSGSIASPSGNRADDLWALQPSANRFVLYTNDLYANGGLERTGGFYFDSANARSIEIPECDGCAGYTATWSDVRQIIAPGDVNGDTTPDVIITKANGSLWLYPSNFSGGFKTPQRIPGTDWASWTLINPGDSTGDGVPDLWAIDNRTAANGGTGAIRMYRVVQYLAADPVDNTISLAPPLSQPSVFGPTSRRLVASPGDTDKDGIPELYTVTPAGAVWEDEPDAKSSTSFHFGAHSVIDDGAGVNSWPTLTAFS